MDLSAIIRIVRYEKKQNLNQSAHSVCEFSAPWLCRAKEFLDGQIGLWITMLIQELFSYSKPTHLILHLADPGFILPCSVGSDQIRCLLKKAI